MQIITDALNQASVAQGKMEAEIHLAINAAMNKFKEYTGRSPSSIKVVLIESTNMEDTSPQFVVGRVETDVSL